MALISIDSRNIGINMHTSYPAYRSRLPQLVAAVKDIGLGIIRDNNPVGAPLLRSAGWDGPVLTVVGNAADADRAVLAGSNYIDPVNEPAFPNNVLDPAARQAISDIVLKVSNRAQLVATSQSQPSDARATSLGYQPFAFRGNAHCYRGMLSAQAWASKQANFIRLAGVAASGKATWVTETGYHDYQVPGKDQNYIGPENSNHPMTPDSVAATTIGSDIDAFFATGAEAVFVYELIDQAAYRTIDGVGDHEGYFGLLREDLSYKLQAQALKDQIATWNAASPNPVNLQRQLTNALVSRDAAISDANTANSKLNNAKSALQTLMSS
jgi:hypothetical protein